MISCQDLSDLLLDYLASELDDELRRAVDQHLNACPSCFAFCHTYRMTISLSRKLTYQPVPPSLIEKIQMRFAQPRL